MGGYSMEQDFNTFFQANERRIYYQLYRLAIQQSLHEECYSEGVLAMRDSYKNYQPGKGDIGTYMNYRIRFRVIDLIRKNKRDESNMQVVEYEQTIHIDDGNRQSQSKYPLVHARGIIVQDEVFWQEVRKSLTEKQWKWVHYFIIADLTIKEIMEIENVSADAVKSWAQQVKKKLRHEEMRKRLEALL